MLTDFIMEQESCLMMVAASGALHGSLVKPNKQIKTREQTVESHLIQQSLDMKWSVDFADRAFQNMTLQPKQWGRVFDRSSSWREMDL
jgi:hypothetical protein